MMIALWLLTLMAVGLWSLMAWGLHTVLTLNPSAIAGLDPWIEQMPYGAVIGQWIPGWQAMLQAALDLTQALLAWVGGAAPVIVWGLWGLGVAMLVGTALVLSLVIRWLRRGGTPGARAAA